MATNTWRVSPPESRGEGGDPNKREALETRFWKSSMARRKTIQRLVSGHYDNMRGTLNECERNDCRTHHTTDPRNDSFFGTHADPSHQAEHRSSDTQFVVFKKRSFEVVEVLTSFSDRTLVVFEYLATREQPSLPVASCPIYSTTLPIRASNSQMKNDHVLSPDMPSAVRQ